MQKFIKLSRAEMKHVLGGSGQGQAYCTYSGTCASWAGAPTGPYDQQDGDGSPGVILANEYQRKADNWCAAHDCCTDADCPGATSPSGPGGPPP